MVLCPASIKLTLQSVDSLTTQQITDFKEAFRLFDRDNDGRIESSVLGTVIRSLGFNPTNAQISDIISELPEDPIDFSSVCTPSQTVA